MVLFWIILLVNTLTMIVTILTAIQKPALISTVAAIVATSAFGAALHQVLKAQANVFALPLTILLALLLTSRMHRADGTTRVRRG